MVDSLAIEVVLPGPPEVVRRRLEVAPGTTAWQAVQASGLAGEYGDRIDPRRMGIFSRRVEPDTPLRDGDRVELYRPLLLDPKEARRLRATGS